MHLWSTLTPTTTKNPLYPRTEPGVAVVDIYHFATILNTHGQPVTLQYYRNEHLISPITSKTLREPVPLLMATCPAWAESSNPDKPATLAVKCFPTPQYPHIELDRIADKFEKTDWLDFIENPAPAVATYWRVSRTLAAIAPVIGAEGWFTTGYDETTAISTPCYTAENNPFIGGNNLILAHKLLPT
jgi:hypothetical protein